MPTTVWADSEVREQYENLPYPLRDPEDDKKHLVKVPFENLNRLNYRCYNGRCDFNDRFRVLVAGGGTGDSAIYLAHQLRGTNAEIDYVDISPAIDLVNEFVANLRRLDWNMVFFNLFLLVHCDIDCLLLLLCFYQCIVNFLIAHVAIFTEKRHIFQIIQVGS